MPAWPTVVPTPIPPLIPQAAQTLAGLMMMPTIHQQRRTEARRQWATDRGLQRTDSDRANIAVMRQCVAMCHPICPPARKLTLVDMCQLSSSAVSSSVLPLDLTPAEVCRPPQFFRCILS